ncbi:MAG TPA: S9 family peptidase [Candidatus Baltobacteraceae bacterium]|nr:S9 family peptidase [Candidatus Baltobacteraceae bacterium]
MKKLALMPLLACVFLVPHALAARAAAPPLTLAGLRSLVGVSHVNISSDGTKVVFIASYGDYKHDRYEKRLMEVSSAGGATAMLTGVLKGLDDPQWSPSGDRIAYLADDDHDVAQVYTVSANGTKPVQVTRAKRDVEQYAWNPAGTLIAYVTADGPADPAAAARHDDLWSVHDDGFLTTYQPRPSHLWIAQSDGSSDRRLTEGSWGVLEAAPPFVGTATDPSWSANGKSIVFTMQSNADDSDSDRTSIAMVDVASGTVTKLDKRTQYEYQPVYAPRANDIAYLYPHGPGPISVLDVFIGNANSNRDATPALNRDVTDVGWLPGNRLLMLVSDGPQTALYAQGPTGRAARLPLGALNPSEFSIAKNGAIAFVASTTAQPSEVYLLPAAGATVRRLTNLNPRFNLFAYGKSEEITWRAADGTRSDGILTYPVGYVAGKKYPLVLRIHGGPEAFTSLAFEPLRQLFAGLGYFVFEPNYRGSDNLGNAHEHAIYKDPGEGPGNDVMAGVAALEKTGMIDTSREAVTGHSYGGYMTTWIIGHWHHWRSAVVGDGMVDWVEEYNLSGTGNLAWTRDSLGGSPWNPRVAPLYRSGSPITYVHQIVTPTLIISGTADEQVPVSESYELYHALHDEGVPVRFIAIPTAKHHPNDPVRTEGYDRVTLDWVERHMR